MICFHCGKNYNRVLNSRDTKKSTQIWRRRQCLNCKEVFTTYEMVDLSYLKVVKKTGRVQRFDPIKIYAGLLQACLYSKHADKGRMALLAKKLTDEILLEIARLKLKRVDSSKIRDLVLDLLYNKSPEVFLRYLAYVKPPESPHMLRKELKVFLK